MPYDLKKISEKLEILKNPMLKNKKFDRKTWAPDKDKKKIVRFVEVPNQEDPFVELSFHYGLGYSFLCPRQNSGHDCPVCSFGFELRKSKNPTEAAMYKKFMPKQRFYGVIVDREDSQLKPRWWGFGKEIYGQLLEALGSEDYGTFMDPYQGFDAEVSVVVKSGASAEYNAPKLTFKRKESKLTDDPKKLEEILSTIEPLSEIYKPLTASEIQQRLSDFLNMSDKDGEEVKKTSAGTEVASDSDTDQKDYKNIDDAFEAALKEED